VWQMLIRQSKLRDMINSFMVISSHRLVKHSHTKELSFKLRLNARRERAFWSSRKENLMCNKIRCKEAKFSKVLNSSGEQFYDQYFCDLNWGSRQGEDLVGILSHKITGHTWNTTYLSKWVPWFIFPKYHFDFPVVRIDRKETC
jgi:hypothetical protein